jgi:hypothetical protein
MTKCEYLVKLYCERRLMTDLLRRKVTENHLKGRTRWVARSAELLAPYSCCVHNQCASIEQHDLVGIKVGFMKRCSGWLDLR